MTPIRRDVGNLIRASGVGIQVDVLASGFDIHRLDIVGIRRPEAPEDVVFVSGCAYAAVVAHASGVIGIPLDRPGLCLMRWACLRWFRASYQLIARAEGIKMVAIDTKLLRCIVKDSSQDLFTAGG